LLWLAPPAAAQVTVQGYIKNKSNGQPLPGATIELTSPRKLAVADEQGYFQFTKLSGQEFTAEVRFVGFAAQQLSLRADQPIEIALEEIATLTDEVIVAATRASLRSATTFSNISKGAIQKQNFGQDLPFVLNWSPSVVTTSDAGAGVGYTGLRIRGSDATRINVTINGIPLNDSESQGVFWVNTPDLASSTQSIQLQRGVGTSTNGAAAFGATLNVQTNSLNPSAYADVVNSFGSFNTWRHTVALGSGLISEKFTVDARLSRIISDGFIDRASSQLQSYYLAGGYYGKKTLLKAIGFGGKEVTYQSWYGVPESRLQNNVAAMLETAAAEGWSQQQTDLLLQSGARTFNIYTYPNQVDNYQQHHYQLHSSHQLTPQLIVNMAAHYTRGFGYYEELRTNEAFADYGLPDAVVGSETISFTDLVRRRWLDNYFYGLTYSVQWDRERVQSVLGGGWNRYDGNHYGEIIWAAVATNAPKDYRYYFNNGVKTDFNIFWKTTFQFTDKLSGFADLQVRKLDYTAGGRENRQFLFNIDKQFNFFNPKLGLTYALKSDQQLYASYSVANREPVRSDFVDAPAGSNPRHETLRNIEAGWRLQRSAYSFNANYYLMDYGNQLVLTGAVNDVGAAIRTNVADSYRSGVEVEGSARLSPQFTLAANATVSRNKIEEFREVLYNYGTNFDEFNEVQNTYRNTDISFSPSLVAGSVLTWQLPSGVELAWLSKYVSRQFLDNTSNRSRALNPYWVNDLRLSYALRPPRMREVVFSLLINNIFDHEYESNGYTWGYLAGSAVYRQNYFYPQAGRNVIAMVAIKI